MLKKYILILFIITHTFNVHAQVVTGALEEKEIKTDKIYFFAHSMCQKCKDAYVYIATNHSKLNIPIVDMKHQANFNLYKQCVKKFNIKNSELSLPLICINNNYIMGWNAEDTKKFDEYVKEFYTK